jgi:hypothetical protein
MPLPRIYEGHCISDVRDVALWAVIIGSLSLPCLFIGPSFQYAKFYKTRSADGVSALTLATGSVARGLTVVNLVILHYDQMVMCYNSKNPPPWYKCQVSQLSSRRTSRTRLSTPTLKCSWQGVVPVDRARSVVRPSRPLPDDCITCCVNEESYQK